MNLYVCEGCQRITGDEDAVIRLNYSCVNCRQKMQPKELCECGLGMFLGDDTIERCDGCGIFRDDDHAKAWLMEALIDNDPHSYRVLAAVSEPFKEMIAAYRNLICVIEDTESPLDGTDRRSQAKAISRGHDSLRPFDEVIV